VLLFGDKSEEIDDLANHAPDPKRLAAHKLYQCLSWRRGFATVPGARFADPKLVPNQRDPALLEFDGSNSAIVGPQRGNHGHCEWLECFKVGV